MKAMNFHRLAWKICGLWYGTNPSYWYIAYATCMATAFYIVFPLFIAFQLFFANSLKEIIEILLILPTAMVGIKAILIHINRRKLLCVFDVLEQMDKFVIKSSAHCAIVHEQLKGSRLLVFLLSAEYYTSVLSQFCLAVMAHERLFMWAMPSWHPFDYQHNAWIYYALLSYQMLASSFIAFTSSSMDVYGLALYKVLGAHVDILGLKLKNLGKPRLAQDKGDGLAASILLDKQSSERDLYECIDYHNLCIR